MPRNCSAADLAPMRQLSAAGPGCTSSRACLGRDGGAARVRRRVTSNGLRACVNQTFWIGLEETIAQLLLPDEAGIADTIAPPIRYSASTGSNCYRAADRVSQLPHPLGYLPR